MKKEANAMKHMHPAKRRWRCLRCGKSLTSGSIPDEKMGGECLGDRNGKHWWTSY